MGISFDSEKDFEDCLFEHQEVMENYIGLNGYTFFRQVRCGGYGIADIVALRSYTDISGRYVDIHIIELKNTTLTPAHLAQVARYKKFFLELARNQPAEFDIRGSLIGKKTFPTSDDFAYLCQSIDWLQVYEFGLDPMAGLELNLVAGWRNSSDHSDDINKMLRILSDITVNMPLPRSAPAECDFPHLELVHDKQAEA